MLCGLYRLSVLRSLHVRRWLALHCADCTICPCGDLFTSEDGWRYIVRTVPSVRAEISSHPKMTGVTLCGLYRLSVRRSLRVRRWLVLHCADCTICLWTVPLDVQIRTGDKGRASGYVKSRKQLKKVSIISSTHSPCNSESSGRRGVFESLPSISRGFCRLPLCVPLMVFSSQ